MVFPWWMGRVTLTAVKYTEAQLQAIYDSIAEPQREPVRRSRLTDNTTPRFRRVYNAPGYPVDPRLEKARALDRAFNLGPYAGKRTMDRSALKRWLALGIN